MDGTAFRKHYVTGLVFFFCLVLVCTGCKDDEDAPWYQGPPLYVVAYEDVTDSAGLTGITATFVAWGDYDKDGLEDLVLDGRRLLRNTGGMTFTDTTVTAGIDPDAGGAGAAWADINNDGYLDLFCSGYEDATSNSLDRLYLNNGDGTFDDITTDADVSDGYDSRACAWGDFNGDGDVDLYVANYEDPPGSGTGAPDMLYINNGGSNPFTDASVSSGINATTARAGRAVACCDFDQNDTMDIFVANDKLAPDFLWVNDGFGSFTNNATPLGVEGTDEGAGFFGSSTGASWGDFDNDRDLDLLVSSQKSATSLSYEDDSHFYNNFGVATLVDWYNISWIAADAGARCPAWLDFNNDTQQDFYLCTEVGSGYLYNGHGSGAFINVAGSAGIGVSKPLGCAFGDYNNDGALDIFICTATGVYLFKNNHDRYNWLKVRLAGSTANAAGIGSVVRVTCPCTTPDTITRQIAGSNGTGCQDSLVTHFGMGDHGGPYTIDIVWSGNSGTTIQQVTGATRNQLHVVTQP